MEAHRKTCRLTCEACAGVFKSKPALANHGCLKFFCLDCGDARFKTLAQLAEHKRTDHQDDSPWKCEECPAKFGRQDRLKRHVDETHKGQKRKTEVAEGSSCAACGFVADRKVNFDRHMRSCRRLNQAAASGSSSSTAAEQQQQEQQASVPTVEAMPPARASSPSSVSLLDLLEALRLELLLV